MPNPIKPTLKTEFIPILFIIVAIIASLYFYQLFPDKVVTHLNAYGQPDGWSGKSFAAFFFPLLNLGIYLLLLFVPYLDPKKDNYKNFTKPYHVIKNTLVIFLSLLYFVVSLNALGYNIPVGLVVPAAVGLLFIILGYYLQDIKPNWFMGIRTPWTLSSEVVWQKTHKFGAKVFMICGVLVILASFLPAFITWFLVVFLALFLSLFIYSYLVYRREK